MIVKKKMVLSIYQWTVLLGNNNTGKTNILKAIAGMRPKKITLHLKKNKQEADNLLVPSIFPLDSSTIFNEDDPKKLKEICLKLTNLNYTWRCGNHGTNIDSECALEKTFNIIAYGVSRYQSAHV